MNLYISKNVTSFFTDIIITVYVNIKSGITNTGFRYQSALNVYEHVHEACLELKYFQFTRKLPKIKKNCVKIDEDSC